MRRHRDAAATFRGTLDVWRGTARKERSLGRSEEGRSSLEFERYSKVDMHQDSLSALAARRSQQTSHESGLLRLLPFGTRDRCLTGVQLLLFGLQTSQTHWHAPHRKIALSHLRPSLVAEFEAAFCYEPQLESGRLRVALTFREQRRRARAVHRLANNVVLTHSNLPLTFQQ